MNIVPKPHLALRENIWHAVVFIDGGFFTAYGRDPLHAYRNLKELISFYMEISK